MPSTTNGVRTTPAIRTSFDLCEAILEKNDAFRALGALLSSARLSEFAPDNYTPTVKIVGERLQAGLNQLFHLIIDDQERTIERFMQEYSDSDEHFLTKAAGSLKLAKEGAFNGGRISENIFKQTMEGLHSVISRNSGLRPVAEAMVEALDQYAPLTVRKVANGGER